MTIGSALVRGGITAVMSLGLVAAACHPARAQSRPVAPDPRVVLGVSLFADHDNTWAREADSAALGASLQVGFRLTRNLRFRVDADVPPWSSGSQQFDAPNYHATEAVRQRMSSLGLSAYLHMNRGARFEIGLLAGVAIVRRRQHATINQTVTAPHGVPMIDGATVDEATTQFRGNVVLGTEAAIRVFGRAAIVPAVVCVVRPFSDHGTLAVRPRLGIRFAF